MIYIILNFVLNLILVYRLQDEESKTFLAYRRNKIQEELEEIPC